MFNTIVVILYGCLVITYLFSQIVIKNKDVLWKINKLIIVLGILFLSVYIVLYIITYHTMPISPGSGMHGY